MAERKKPTWHFEYDWKRTRILVAATLCAVMVWRVMLLPVLRYLERNTDWISADIFKNVGYFNLHLDHTGLLAIMVAGACVFASARTEEAHRSNPLPVAFGVIFAVFANVIFSPFGRLTFALVVALSLVPVVFFTSCLVVRNLSRLRSSIGHGMLALGLFFISIGFYSDEEVAQNRLEYTMYSANYGVRYSHYYAERAPERMYGDTVDALAGAPQPRELWDWQSQLSKRDSVWGQVVDSGASEDFLDFAYRTIGSAETTPVKLFDLADDSAKDMPGLDVQNLSDATLRNLWMVHVAEPGMVKNVYLVTDRQIMRCLTRVVSQPEKRTGIVFINQRPEHDIELDSELLYCFDGQSIYRFEENAPVEFLESPCTPLHGFGNYSTDKVDVLLAFMMRLWAADEADMRDAGRHFFIHGLSEEYRERLLVLLVAGEKQYALGDVAQGDAAVHGAIDLLQDVVLGDSYGKEMSADKRAFLATLFASYVARKTGDEALAGEQDAACLSHRARWYESDPQAGQLARTAVATDSVVTSAMIGNTPLIITLGLTGDALKRIPKTWSEMGFWLRKIEHDRTLIEQASTHFGTILDSFVSTRNQHAEYERVRKLFAKSSDEAFYALQDDGLDITRYFVGSTHNGWCTYRLSLDMGEPSPEDGLSRVSVVSPPRYCRVDDVFVSFDEKGQPAKKWDAAGLPFHAPAVIGNAPRLSGLSDAHRAQLNGEDARDALLRLFLDQLTAGALEDVDALNLELHPGVHSFRDDQRAVMERMRRGGESVE